MPFNSWYRYFYTKRICYKYISVISYLYLKFIQWCLACVQQLLQVLVKILEDKCKFAVSMEHINQAHDIWMLKLLQ